MAKCACTGSFLDRFIQPSILVILTMHSAHGFSIYKKLCDTDILDYTGIDPTGLYRTLKKMEEAGLLISKWDTTSSSQPRRMYSITKDGRNCLKCWHKTLSQYKDNIQVLTDAIKQSLGEE